MSMPEEQQRLLPSFETKLQRSQKALDVNTQLLTKIVISAEKAGSIGPALSAARYCSSQPNPAISPLDASKVGGSNFTNAVFSLSQPDTIPSKTSLPPAGKDVCLVVPTQSQIVYVYKRE